MNLYPILLTAVTANQDLFSTEWTEGNLYSINGIVDKLGTFSCWVISIVGFGIVIFSILKNAFSGLYVVNPNFWDKVDDVKCQALGYKNGQATGGGIAGTITQMTGNGNVAAQKLGGLFTFLLSIVPNVKALTDFEDDAPVDKKQYFMRSIPLLVAQIFIGMLIFFGYPAKIANWIGSGATYALSAVINNVDPVQLVSKVSDSFTVYNLSTDGSQDPLEQNINTMTSDMVSTMATKYSDMDKSNVQNIAYLLEQNLLNAFDSEGAKRVLGADEGYVISSSALIQTSTPSVSASYGDIGNGVYQAMATNGTVSFKYWISASSILDSNYTTKLGSDDYFVWTVTATPVAVADISTANVIVCGGISTVPEVSGSNFSLTIKGITVGSDNSDIKGSLGKVVTVSAIDSTGNTLKTFNATLQTASVSQKSGATPLLTFSSSDRENLQTALSSASYLKVSLVGDWSKTVTSTDGRSTTTVRITEFRLNPSATTATYLLSTWTDVDLTTSTGVDNLTASTLKQSAMNESN